MSQYSTQSNSIPQNAPPRADQLSVRLFFSCQLGGFLGAWLSSVRSDCHHGVPQEEQTPPSECPPSPFLCFVCHLVTSVPSLLRPRWPIWPRKPRLAPAALPPPAVWRSLSITLFLCETFRRPRHSMVKFLAAPKAGPQKSGSTITCVCAKALPLSSLSSLSSG